MSSLWKSNLLLFWFQWFYQVPILHVQTWHLISPLFVLPEQQVSIYDYFFFCKILIMGWKTVCEMGARTCNSTQKALFNTRGNDGYSLPIHYALELAEWPLNLMSALVYARGICLYTEAMIPGEIICTGRQWHQVSPKYYFICDYYCCSFTDIWSIIIVVIIITISCEWPGKDESIEEQYSLQPG